MSDKNKDDKNSKEQLPKEDNDVYENSSVNVTYEEELLPMDNKITQEASDSRLIINEPDPENIVNQLDTSYLQNLNALNGNDDLSDSGYMTTNFSSNLDEIFENLLYLLTAEKNKIKGEKEQLQKSMQKFLDYKAQESIKMDKEREKWKMNMQIANDMNYQASDLVDLDIGGTYKITTTKKTLTKYPLSSLGIMFNGKHEPLMHNNRVFIDRDAQAFVNMLSFLRNGKLPPFNDYKDKQCFYDELDFWQIPFSEGKDILQCPFIFDPEWCAKTLSLESNRMKINKTMNQHGIVFCKPPLDEVNPYIEFKVTIITHCKGKTHLFLGLVDKSKYKYENLKSTYWKDSPSSFYWDTWNTKLIKTDDKGGQIAQLNGYGCQCEEKETYLGIKYDASAKTVSFYKNHVSMGIAFKNVPSGMTPSLDVWFEFGSVEIVKTSSCESQRVFL